VRQEFLALDLPVNIDKSTPDRRRTIFASGGDRANVVPQVSMINCLFLREHNRLARDVERLHPDWDDDHVFEVVRNTVIVLFIKIGVEEYINHISPLSYRMKADPRVAWRAPWNRPNRIAIEFSLLYRWHSLIPETVVWGGLRYPIQDTILNNKLLIDSGLADAFENVTAQNAMRLGARNTANMMLPFEASAIEQSRLCEVAAFADYCENTSAARPETFEDMSSDPVIVDLLRRLYGAPDRVEFYVGLFAQDTLPNSPLPDLMLKLAAMDAFSHAFTNPLLSERAFNESTFSPVGWKAIAETSCLRDVLQRNVGPERQVGHVSITRSDWTYTHERPVIDEIRDAFVLATSRLGRIKLAGFAVSTVAEAGGLIAWLALTSSGAPLAGFLWLVLGEAAEWSLLALLIVYSPQSHPRRTGSIPGALLKSGATSLSEAFLWVAWLFVIPHAGLTVATLVLLVAMHLKHAREISIFTGKRMSRHLWDGRDMTASMIETFGAAAWYWVAAAVSPIAGGLVLIAVLAAEHLLQFKSAGFWSPDER
jgi:hypothetical protein